MTPHHVRRRVKKHKWAFSLSGGAITVWSHWSAAAGDRSHDGRVAAEGVGDRGKVGEKGV